MRNLLFSFLILAALGWGFVSAEGSVMSLIWICFQRPQDFSDWWEGTPIFQAALAICIVSNIARGKFRLKFPAVLLLYEWLMFWLVLSAAFAFDTDHSLEYAKSYLPSMIVTPIVLFAVINDLELLKRVMWIAAGALGVNAAKVAIVLSLRGGYHITEAVTGFVGDNNGFGLVLCLAVPILIGLKSTLPPKKWLHRGLIVVIVGASLCIIYTESRGALITLATIIFLRSIIGKNAIRNTSIFVGVVILAYLVIPSHFFERLDTLKNVQGDESAMGRVENWGLSWEEAKQYPFFGVGPDNHQRYNHALGVSVQVRVAHSTYFELLGENGFLGLFWYLIFLFTGIGVLFATWSRAARVAVTRPEFVWVRDASSWMACAGVGYVLGSAFLNMLYFEFPFYMFFFGAMLRRFLPADRPDPVAARGGLPRTAASRPRSNLARRGTP